MTTTTQLLSQAAARNNAEWCAVITRSHGLDGEFTQQAWSAPARTPLYYPDAVTLVPEADVFTLLAQIDTKAPGASVKDSFADLDLTHAGFHVLFDAQWIHRPTDVAVAALAATDLAWDVVTDPQMLRAWAQAWDAGKGNADLFRPGLLDDSATFVLVGRRGDGHVISGAVASRSDHVVGISNVFALEGGADAAWPGVLDVVHRLFPTLPIVGYEHGEELSAALHHGFKPIGPLRIWRKD